MPSKFLQSSHIGDLTFNKESLIQVKSTTTLQQVSDLLARHNILSVPVCDEDNKFLGIVDALDLVKYVAFGRTSGSPKKYETVAVPDEVDLAVRIETLNIAKDSTSDFAKTTVGELLGLLESSEGCSRELQVFDSHELLSNLLDPLGTSTTPRVIVRAHKTCFEQQHYLVSQSDVVSYFVQHKSELDNGLLQTSVSDLGLPREQIPYFVSTEDRTIDGLRKMVLLGIPAVAVVHPLTGAIVGTLSSADLRGLSAEQFPLLLQSVAHFLGELPANNRPARTVSVHPSTTLEEVMSKIVDNKVHRVWVVTENDCRPVGVICLADVIQVILKSSVSAQ